MFSNNITSYYACSIPSVYDCRLNLTACKRIFMMYLTLNDSLTPCFPCQVCLTSCSCGMRHSHWPHQNKVIQLHPRQLSQLTCSLSSKSSFLLFTSSFGCFQSPSVGQKNLFIFCDKLGVIHPGALDGFKKKTITQWE